MRPRGQGALTLAVALVVAVVAVGFDRLGVREPAGAAPGAVASGTWLCPHGGGDGYAGTVFLANPGDEAVTARVTGLTAEGTSPPSRVEVPPGAQVAVEVEATARSSSTYVETFGGWAAAGWVIRGAEGEPGVGAEPCVADASREWHSSGASTGRGDDAFLVVVNPFDVDAVFDVALFASDRAPIRDTELTDVTLRPHRSTAIKLNGFAQGEPGLGLSIDTKAGRVAAGTLMVSKGQGISNVVASAAPVTRQLLLTSTGAGRSVVAVTVPTVVAGTGEEPTPPGQLGSTFGATLRSEDQPRPVGALAERTQEPESAASYAFTTTGPSAVDLVVRDGAPVVAAVRTAGVGRDRAATAGSPRPASSWVVTPSVAGSPARPGLLLLNAGASPSVVTVRTLPGEGDRSSETTVTVPPGRVAAVPRAFMDGVGMASLEVVADGPPVVALGASTSIGSEGLSLFGLAAGVPIPVIETP